MALSQQYQSVFTVDDGNIPDGDQLMPAESLSNIEITDADIVLSIRKMNVNGSPGPDGIHPRFVKNLLSFLVEQVLHSKMLAYFQLAGIITEKQHGFLCRRSTTTNLFETLNDWTELVDNKSSVDVLYIDLEKAFDSVSHPKLLAKLRRCGIGGSLFQWIGNFLSCRRQCVRVGCSLSPYMNVISGIPQGTILGPLLFLLYINDLPGIPEGKTVSSLFADDSKFYHISNNISDCLEFANDIIGIQEWLDMWQLKINLTKCVVLHLGHSNILFPHRINQFIVEKQFFCRDLGVHVASDFSAFNHCSIIVRNAMYRLHQFRKTFTGRRIDFKIFLFVTYIRPLVESNTAVWSPHYIQDIDMVEKVQRKFTKYLTGLRNMSYKERLQYLHLDTLEVRRIQFDLILMYKIIHNIVDIPFNKYFHFNTNSTRGHDYKLVCQYSRLDCRKYFFTNRVVNYWNDLPASIVNARSLVSFKKLVRSHDLSGFCKGSAYS